MIGTRLGGKGIAAGTPFSDREATNMARELTIDIVRAWKDPMYRKRLTPLELASLPPNPAGDSQVETEELVRTVRSWLEFLGSCDPYTDNVTYWSCHCDFSARESVENLR